MNARKKPLDRRKHKRFLVRDGTLAVFGRTRTTVGSIIDISMGGLAFSYLTDEELPNGPSEIDILLASGLSHLYGLPCETVYDIKTNGTPLALIGKRRRGVKFGDLTPNQKLHLEHFIKNHTTDELPPWHAVTASPDWVEKPSSQQ